MPPPPPQTVSTKRRLILHDLLAFTVLLAVTATLFAVTLLLFQSFEQHRQVLAARWSDRGQQALTQGRSEEAVFALRTALSYTVDDQDARTRQVLLAQALAGAGHVGEAISYFEALWDTHPGDGFINLQLARLERRQHDETKALEYYRASVSGTWEGDGLARRREVRFEMIDLLIAQRQASEARQELSIIAANAPDDPRIDIALAQRLEAAGDSAGAAIFTQKAAHLSPAVSGEQAKEHTDDR